MKRKIIAGIFLTLLATAFTGCEGLLDNCKVCSLNTYENDVLILSQNEADYCDAELISIQAQSPQYIGNTVILWECN